MTKENLKKALHCLDDYMEQQGKHVINEMEANSELARQGLLEDDMEHPGRPLRELLAKLRDSNLLPRNIRQTLGAWFIKNSRATQVRQQFYFF